MIAPKNWHAIGSRELSLIVTAAGWQPPDAVGGTTRATEVDTTAANDKLFVEVLPI